MSELTNQAIATNTSTQLPASPMSRCRCRVKIVSMMCSRSSDELAGEAPAHFFAGVRVDEQLIHGAWKWLAGRGVDPVAHIEQSGLGGLEPEGH